MDRTALAQQFHAVRARSLAIAAPLSAEDQCVQSMPDASPTKWHLAHTTWFFETLALAVHAPGYRVFDERYALLFNSYYESLGPRHPRPQRGVLSRPALDEVHVYRRHVETAIDALLRECPDETWPDVHAILTLGLHHEQQHQELMLTDILHMLSSNPLLPAYETANSSTAPQPECALQWRDMPGGIVNIGHQGEDFAFDNETPRHEALLHPYQIANRLVTCEEYAAFIADGGYQRADLWLSDGWAAVKAQDWRAPLYWLATGDARAPGNDWQVFGVHGVQAVDLFAPVCNLSFYEASAYAQWAGARLPTEFEWEAAFDAPGMTQMKGHAWQWTRSSYDPYPGFQPFAGAAGEYNGKFMVGQLVLRGGSFATPEGHARSTYRNFFPPASRWQFSGIRLAKDAS
jgi:ergothioneine biosynthesis protein EgtB